MPERRSDDETTLVTEYALFLAETRGLASGLAYLDGRQKGKEALLRAIQSSSGRRTSERRREKRK